MPTISSYQLKSGRRWRSQVRIKRKGVIIHQESRRGFRTATEAREWGEKLEQTLAHPGQLEKAQAKRGSRGLTTSDLIQKYIDQFGGGRTKLAHLKQLQGYEIASVPPANLTSDLLIQHVTERRAEKVSASTVANDLIWLGVVFKAAGPVWKMDLDTREIESARHFCRTHNLIGKSKRRGRRPSPDELDRLTEFFSNRDGRADIPMLDIMWFAIHSCRRQAEITRLLWSDNDEKSMTGLVRDLKHPRSKEGNHRRFKYTREAWEIVQRQPRSAQEIFPYNSRSIGAAFTRACHVLEIKDLRFHDLRREGVSRLFEAGYSITEVVQFSLHEDWKSLQVYAGMRPEDLVLR